MIEHARSAKEYWGEPLMTAVFLRNYLPKARLRLCTWNGHRKRQNSQTSRDTALMRVCNVSNEKRLKLNAQARFSRFLGYSEHEKAYRFEQSSTGRIIDSRDAKLTENTFDSEKHRLTSSMSNEFYSISADTDTIKNDKDLQEDESKSSPF